MKFYLKLGDNNEITRITRTDYNDFVEVEAIYKDEIERMETIEKSVNNAIGYQMYKYVDNKIQMRDWKEYTPIEDYKVSRVKNVKERANELILAKYPIWKQINYINSVLPEDEEKRDEMNAYIADIRIKSKALETLINECSAYDALLNLDLTLEP